MLIHVRGVRSVDREDVRGAVLECLHNNGIHYDYWSWAWGNPVEVTDDDGSMVTNGGIAIELPGTEAVRKAVSDGLLEAISGHPLLQDVVVYVKMAPVEASFNGNRL